MLEEDTETWGSDDEGDPNAQPPLSRKLVTQPFDLTVGTLLGQIKSGTLHLKPLSGRPKLQRRYVWNDRLASRLMESMLLNVPIPPCYFAQDEDFEHEVIDGQQRLYSLHRFHDNQFSLSGLDTLSELNGFHYFELPANLKNKLLNYTLRCVVITNDSDEELRFDVFERLNSNTVPLNAQELRNCVYRGELIDMLAELAENNLWLSVLKRKRPDPRMKDEELILRYFAFRHLGLQTYRTPQKFWLNRMADVAKKLPPASLAQLKDSWLAGLENAVSIFGIGEAFRREKMGTKAPPINKALVDLNILTLGQISAQQAANMAVSYRDAHRSLLQNAEFADLISRAVDHKSRTDRRFELWDLAMAPLGVSAS